MTTIGLISQLGREADELAIYEHDRGSRTRVYRETSLAFWSELDLLPVTSGFQKKFNYKATLSFDKLCHLKTNQWTRNDKKKK